MRQGLVDIKMIKAVRYHDFSAGHRVVGHENKCKTFHGHNYRVYFHCVGELDSLGRVVDFGVIKSTLCEWLEENWDHKMLLWDNDPMLSAFCAMDRQSVVPLSFNPTAENMARFLCEWVGPYVLKDSGVTLQRVEVQETRKCSAIATV
jgi:6-pyruvoyltetrahydropterin/6-carboxytetrahydropterin synthase